MSKATVTRFFIGGLLAVLTGAIVAVAAVWVAIANDVFVMDGPNIVGITGGTLNIALAGLGIVGAAAVLAGFVAGLVAWVGALLNTAQIANKAWFIALLAHRDLQPRVHRDDRLRRGRAGRHDRLGPEERAGAGQRGQCLSVGGDHD